MKCDHKKVSCKTCHAVLSHCNHMKPVRIHEMEHCPEGLEKDKCPRAAKLAAELEEKALRTITTAG